MRRIVFTVIGILSLSLVAAGLTEATLALGHRGHLHDDRHARPGATPKPSVTPTLTPTPNASPTSTPVPTTAPAPTPAARTAVTNGFVRMRAGASTSTAIVVELNGGTVVTLGTYSDSQWQQVQYNGLNGYIFKSYLNFTQ